MRKPMAFPVRFVSEGQTVQTTSRELDEDGVFVRCVEPPGVGERVVLRLYLPGIAAGDSIEAVVEESEGDGFRARFVDLDEEAKAHVRNALEGKGSAEPAPVEPDELDHGNRRYLPRYLDRFTVHVGRDESSASANLSGSGMFIETSEPPEVDAIVHVVLDLPDGRAPLGVQALVLRRLLPGEGKAPGAGVQFIAGDDDFRERLDAYLETLGNKR